MIRSYINAVKYLESFIPTPEMKHPGKLGIKRMRYLVKLLGNPQNAYPIIHVGGTSGKGSTATIIASILSTKYKVGLHTSPHLVKINERIRIFSRGPLAEIARGPLMKDISDKEFIELINDVYPAIKKVEESKQGKPSYFEIVTAMAFLYFKKEKVDIAVIEVGMGGRFDATNVIKPLVAVITNVGLDHTEILGDTVEEIARDKVGIIKSGTPVATGVRQPSVIEIVEKICMEKEAPFSLLVPSPRGSTFAHPQGGFKAFSYKIKKITSAGSVFDYFGDQTYKNLKLSLLGEHQVENAVLAIRAIELLRKSAEVSSLFCAPLKLAPYNNNARGRESAQKASFPADLDSISKGLKQAFIPGRLEIVHKRPTVILDGAHNPDKMKALVIAIKDIFPDKRIIAVVAIKSGKDAQGILKEILPICHEIIFTKFRLTTDLGDTFSYTPAELKKVISRGPLAISARSPLIKSDPVSAVEEAINSTNPDDIILVTGSLYLVGEIKKVLSIKY